MDIFPQLIQSLNKEEVRNLKLFLTRTNNTSERKDVQLFDYMRKQNEAAEEETIIKKLYSESDRNSYYRLKNRLQEDILKSLTQLNFSYNPAILSIHYLIASRLFKDKKNQPLSFYFLKRAEKKAREDNAQELLDIIYGDIIKLSLEYVNVNPEEYIEKRKKNREELNHIHEIDDLISVLTYRIRSAQNFQRDKKILNVLQKTINEYSQDKKLKKNIALRFRIYDAISRMLLQQQNYTALETYLEKTYAEFNKEHLFKEENHEYKLQMLTYLVNSLFKNEKIKESLHYTSLLKKAMEEYNSALYEKYLFYYYNSLVINYSVIDKPKAIKTLEEAKDIASIKKLPVYTVFIYLNLGVISFDLRDFKYALKNIVHMMLHDSFKSLDAGFRLKISVAELLIRCELQDFDVIEKRIRQIQKEFKEQLEQAVFLREVKALELIGLFLHGPLDKHYQSFLKKGKDFLKAHSSAQEQDADVINFNKWLQEKIK